MDSRREAIAFGLTSPAVVSFVAYAVSQWGDPLRTMRYVTDLVGALGFYTGILSIITSLICLIGIRVRSSKSILACQILNGVWLACIFYIVALIASDPRKLFES
jgi:hypothetical protein